SPGAEKRRARHGGSENAGDDWRVPRMEADAAHAGLRVAVRPVGRRVDEGDAQGHPRVDAAVRLLPRRGRRSRGDRRTGGAPVVPGHVVSGRDVWVAQVGHQLDVLGVEREALLERGDVRRVGTRHTAATVTATRRGAGGRHRCAPPATGPFTVWSVRTAGACTSWIPSMQPSTRSTWLPRRAASP